jgi:hypothetical protein
MAISYIIEGNVNLYDTVVTSFSLSHEQRNDRFLLLLLQERANLRLNSRNPNHAFRTCTAATRR